MLKPLPAGKWNFTTAAHLLNRAGFGGPPAEIEKLVKLGPDVTTTAGLPIFSRGSIADPGPGPWHATVDYGDGTGPRALPVGGNKSFHLTHRFTQPGDYTVTVAVTDPDGAAGTASFVVHVVPPVVRRPLTPAARPTGGRR